MSICKQLEELKKRHFDALKELTKSLTALKIVLDKHIKENKHAN